MKSTHYVIQIWIYQNVSIYQKSNVIFLWVIKNVFKLTPFIIIQLLTTLQICFMYFTQKEMLLHFIWLI